FFLALSVGAGLGLVAALSSMLRRHAPPARPWVPSPVLEESTMDKKPAPRPQPTPPSKPAAEPSNPAGPSPKPARASPAAPAAAARAAAARAAAAKAAAAKAAAAKAAAAKAGVTARVRAADPTDPTDAPDDEVPGGIGRRQLAGFLAAGAVGAVAGGTLGATF